MDTQTVPVAPDTEPSDSEARAAYIAGVRAVADFLEANPAVPIDDHDHLGPWLSAFSDGIGAGSAIEIAAAMDATVRHETTYGDYVYLERTFGPVTYRVTVNARDVCEEREELTKVSVLPDALRAREVK